MGEVDTLRHKSIERPFRELAQAHSGTRLCIGIQQRHRPCPSQRDGAYSGTAGESAASTSKTFSCDNLAIIAGHILVTYLLTFWRITHDGEDL